MFVLEFVEGCGMLYFSGTVGGEGGVVGVELCAEVEFISNEFQLHLVCYLEGSLQSCHTSVSVGGGD